MTIQIVYTDTPNASNRLEDRLGAVGSGGVTGSLDFSQAPYNGVGDGVTDNRAAWFTFVADCISQNKAGFIPPGTFLVTLTSGNPYPTIAGNLTLYGAGKGLSNLKVNPTVAVAGGFQMALLYAATANFDVSLRDLSFIGPSSVTGFGDLLPDVSVLYQTYSGTTGPRSNLTAENCSASGAWTTVFYRTGHFDGTTRLLNVDVAGNLSSSLAEFDGAFAQTDRRVEVRGGSFVSGLPGSQTSDGSPYGNTFYVHPHIAMSFDGGWRIGTNYRTGVAHYSASGAPGAPTPKEERFANGTFEDTQLRACITSFAAGAASVFTGVTFQTGLICLQGQAQLNGCVIREAATIGATDSADYQAATFDVVLNGCTWMRGASSTNDTYSSHQNLRINGGTILATGAVTTAAPINLGSGPLTRLSGTALLAPSAVGAGSLVTCAPTGSNTVVFDQCSFEGNYSQGAVAVTIGAPAGSVLFNNCRSDLADRVLYLNGTPADSVEFRGHRWGTSTTNGGSGPGLQRVVLRGGKASSVASASSITLDLDHDLFPVSGTTTINTLAGLTTTYTDAEGSTIGLIATGAWALGTSGNIAPLTTAARASGDVVWLTYQRGSGKWLEAVSKLPMSVVVSGSTSDGVAVDSSTILSAGQKTALTGGGDASGQHTHAASDLASGVIATARLGSGAVGDGSTVLYDNGTWAPPPGASGTGEINTLSSENLTGISIVGTKTGTALGIYGVAAASSRVAVTRDTTNHVASLDVTTGTTAGTVAAGDDARLTGATNLASHTIASQATGDLIAASSPSAWARVAGNTTTAKEFLTSTGDGVNATAPAWGTIATGDLPTIPATGGGTGLTTYTTGDLVYASATNTLSKLAKGASGTILQMGASVPAWGNPSLATLVANVQAKATAYTLTGTDDVIEASLTTAQTYTLPAATSNKGRLYRLAHTGTPGAVATIARAGSDTFTGGFTSWELRTRGEWVILCGNAAGNGWDVLGASYSDCAVEKGNSTTALALAWTPTQQVFHSTLTGNCAVTLSQIPVGGAMTVLLDTGAGGFTATFAVTGLGSLRWYGGAPTVTMTAGKRDSFLFEYDGTNVYGSVLGQGA